MSTPANTQSGVNIIIDGIIVLFFTSNDDQVVACQAGVLDPKDAPGHEFVVTLEKKDQAGQVQNIRLDPIENEIRLEVRGPAQTGIQFEAMDAEINRVTGAGDERSFKWVLDFEGNEVYGRPIGADRTRFRSIFRVDHGRFYTNRISQNHLLARNSAALPDQWTLIGKVATEVGIFLPLDAEGSEVEFFNGLSSLVSAGPGEQLEIRVRLVHPDNTPPDVRHNDDANFFHTAIGTELTENDLKVFTSTPIITGGALPPVSPEASCLVGRMGRSNI